MEEERRGGRGRSGDKDCRRHDKDEASGKKVPRKKMTRNSFVRMRVVDKIDRAQPEQACA